MVDKKLSRAYQAPVPAGQVINWIGSPPDNAGVLPLKGQGFNGAHFPELLAQHGDAVLPSKPAVDGVYPVVGHGEQGDVHLVSNDTTVAFDETVHDFGETIYGFSTEGDVVIVWGYLGKVWGSTDGGVNFTLLPSYLNSGSPGYGGYSAFVRDVQFGNGVWLVSFDDYFAICRGDILVPANWQALPQNLGGLIAGITDTMHKIATDGKGNWFVAGKWHQFAWTNDDWITINLTEQPNNSNYTTVKIPCTSSFYGSEAFVWCSDDGVFFAGSISSDYYRSDDGGTIWTRGSYGFNTGVINVSNPQLIIDMGDGHYMVLYGSQYVAESFDRGVTWVRRAQYLGLGNALYNLATDKKGMLLVNRHNGGTYIYTSKNSGQTFDAGSNHLVHHSRTMQYWRDAWYGIDPEDQKLIRSITGYIRTEWEVKP